ncbi:ferredoxin [Clostridia bacterium]|nr:ferredoxin [Clostridia bacterium]
MAYKISTTCINCGTCVGVCPVDAITRGQIVHEINQDLCIGCGACAASCPVGAPVAED